MCGNPNVSEKITKKSQKMGYVCFTKTVMPVDTLMRALLSAERLYVPAENAALVPVTL